MLVKIFAELFVDQRFDQALDVAIELALGLALELRLRELHGNDGDEPLADVVTVDGDFILLLFEQAEGIGVVVDGARERGTEAGEMRSSIDSVNRVREGENI